MIYQFTGDGDHFAWIHLGELFTTSTSEMIKNGEVFFVIEEENNRCVCLTIHGLRLMSKELVEIMSAKLK